MREEHNNVWCERFFDRVFPDQTGSCRLCGALLHELTADEAMRLVERFESIALERTRTENWNATDWLFDDEADALAIAKSTAVSGRR